MDPVSTAKCSAVPRCATCSLTHSGNNRNARRVYPIIVLQSRVVEQRHPLCCFDGLHAAAGFVERGLQHNAEVLVCYQQMGKIGWVCEVGADLAEESVSSGDDIVGIRVGLMVLWDCEDTISTGVAGRWILNLDRAGFERTTVYYMSLNCVGPRGFISSCRCNQLNRCRILEPIEMKIRGK